MLPLTRRIAPLRRPWAFFCWHFFLLPVLLYRCLRMLSKIVSRTKMVPQFVAMVTATVFESSCSTV
jgi:hypothetical protein